MLAIIQVAIGLIFVFSLLSILATTINGVVSNVLKWRAEYLKQGLIELLTDPELQAQFLAHPLIKMVDAAMIMPDETDNPADARAMAAQMSSAKVTNVSWIKPETFAQVLTSLLTEKADLTLYGPLLNAINDLPESPQKFHLLDLAFGLQSAGIGLPEMRAAIQALPMGIQAPLLNALQPIEERRKEAQLSDNSESSRLLPLLEGLRRVNDDAFRRALKVIVASAQTLDEAQKNLENWFDERMNIVTDLYKRRLVFFSLIIGLLLTVLLNADTLQMAKALWDDPALRATIVSAAQGAVANGSLESRIQTPAEPTAQPAVEPTPESGTSVIPPGESVAAAAPTPTPLTNDELAQQFQDTLNVLLDLNLPIGWELTPIDGGCNQGAKNPVECSSMRNLWLLDPANNPNWLGLIVRKLLGVVVTVIAIMQGAPFWFDLLQRLVRGGSSS